MKRALAIVIAGLSANAAGAQDTAATAAAAVEGEETVVMTDAVALTPAEAWLADKTTTFTGADATLEDFLWIARPVVLFADTPADPRFQQQYDFLMDGIEELAERDVVVLIDTDPAAESALREELRPRGFMLALIGKDGGVRLRKPLPWDLRELTRVIDKMPLRQQEVEDRRASGG